MNDTQLNILKMMLKILMMLIQLFLAIFSLFAQDNSSIKTVNNKEDENEDTKIKGENDEEDVLNDINALKKNLKKINRAFEIDENEEE